jgi:glycosyltransferase involved in cell wall biosynthesis
MKILLSAYACEPGKGSEPGVGWNWALALARRGWEVHVLTRSNNREAIQREVAQIRPNLQFHYFDLPNWARFWKYWPGGIYLYYLLWQIGASQIAMRLHARERFELVQHITFVSFRQPSFMGRLGIPFIFGPVGGGESMPLQLRSGLPMRARVAEGIRTAGNWFVTFDPLMRKTYTEARLIACATQETLQSIPARFREKCIVQRAIGIDEAPFKSNTDARSAPMANGTASVRFLFVGRLLYWKGLHLAMQALARVKDKVYEAKLRVVGEGTDAEWLHQVARREGVAERLEWTPRIAHGEMVWEYQTSVGLIFPSLHDSGGMVVLEALSAGLPVICLDRGGPGAMVDSSCGFAIETAGRSEVQIVERLAAAMIRLGRDSELRRQLAIGAERRARDLSWDAAVDGVYSASLIAGLMDRDVHISGWK